MKVPHSVVGRTNAPSQARSYLQQSASPLAFGAGVGQALQGLGLEMERVEAEIKSRNEQTDRFSSLTNLTEFETSVNERLLAMKRDNPPQNGNFVEQAEAEFAKAEQEFLANRVHPDLREEFRFRTGQLRQRIVGDSLTFQYESQDAYFRQGIKDQLSKAQIAVDPRQGGDGSAESQLAWTERVHEAIDASDLTEFEKQQLKLSTAADIAGVAYRAAKLESALAGPPRGPVGAAALIKKFEGFRPGTYWDVNAHRLGYGTDTITDANGRVRSVKQGDRVDRAGAERDLNRRIGEFEGVAAGEVGVDAWAALPDNVRAALISVTYNYGNLPNTVAAAVRGGDIREIANAVEGLSANKDRRRQEAAVIRGEGEIPPDNIDDDPRFNLVPYETRLAYDADAQADANAILSAQQKARNEQMAAQRNAIFTGIIDGNVGRAEVDMAREAGIMTDADDIRKAYDQIKARDEELLATQRAITKLTSSHVWTGSAEDEGDMNRLVGKEGIARLTGQDEEYFSNAIIPLVQGTNDIPTSVVQNLDAMIRSNDPRRAIYALDAAAQLEEVDPRAYAVRVPERMRKDVDLYRGLKDFRTEEQIMEAITGGDVNTRQAIKQLQDDARDILAKKERNVVTSDRLVAAILNSEPFDTLLTDEPLLQPGPAGLALERDHNALFIELYPLYRDEEKTQEAVMKELPRIWGVTGIGGTNYMMKHPPEKVGYKPLNGDYSWIERQVREELEVPAEDRIILISDEQTEMEFQSRQRGEALRQAGAPPAVAQVGGKPSYQVIRFDAEGTPHHYMETTPRGRVPVRLNFEPSAEEVAAEEAAFNFRAADQAQREFFDMYAKALEARAISGVEIPEEIEQEYIERKARQPELEAQRPLTPTQRALAARDAALKARTNAPR